MSELTIRQIKTGEIGHAASFVADVLCGKNRDCYRVLHERYARQLPSRPGKINRLYRGVLKQQQIISLIHTCDFSLRYGRAALNVVVIGTLCTHPRFRERGFASALIRDTLTSAAEQGAHLVLLDSTITGYFQRFGFSPVWATYTLQAPSELAARLSQPHQLRIATPADLPALKQLYDRYWGMRVTAERSMLSWRWRMEHGRGEAAVIVNKMHHIEGYIWHLADDFSSRNEVVAITPDAIATALAYSGRRWLAGGHEQLIWSVPPDDVIIPYARQMLPTTLSASFNPSAGWMARVIDASAFLSELLPEIKAQSTATDPEFDPAQLIMQTTPDGINISLKNNPAAQSHLSLRDFIQLVFGSLRPESLAIRQQLSVAALTLLETLFPPRIAALAAWDWV